MSRVDCKSQPLSTAEQTTAPANTTLRDRFAMVAVDMFAGETIRAADRKGALRQLAKTAYLFADAMMEARK